MAAFAGASAAGAAAAPAPNRYVDVFVGTAVTHGNTNPGATTPFGMTQLSPVTPHAQGGGYVFGDTKIAGFTLTRPSGVPCTLVGVGELMPSATPAGGAERFRHSTEAAQPGYYKVTLASGVVAEMTATTRSGDFRFTFPAGRGYITIPGGRASGNTVTGTTTVPGICGFGGGVAGHYVYRFNKPFTVNGDVLAFHTRQLIVKGAVSFVDARGAARNLARENAGWDFARLRSRAASAWTHELDAIAATGDSRTNLRVFYTALYHSLLAPNTFSDVDHRYTGGDGRTHLAAGYTRYTNISGWDQYRTQFPLLCLLEPAVARDIVLSMLGAYRETGHLPRWQYTGVEQGLMIGDPADAMIADAVAYKVPGIPLPEALAAMVHGATAPQVAKPNRRLVVLIMLGLFLLIAPLPLVRWGRRRHRGRRTNAIAVAYLLLLLSIVELGVSAIPKVPAAGISGPVERPGLSQYLRYGYVPYDHGSGPVWGPASTSEEYYIDDFAISRVAAAAGRVDLAATFSTRARNWRKVVNPVNGYVQPRNKNGTFVGSADSGDASGGYVEADETVYQWLVPFDLGGLIRAIGGDKVALQRLAALFSQPDSSGGLAMANEPGFAMPWTYLWLDQPGKAAATIRRFQEGFADTPAGLPGDDDLGATSSWYVWSALGLYPLIPGVPGYAVIPASFPSLTIRAPKPWVIIGRASMQPWVNASTRAGGPLPSFG